MYRVGLADTRISTGYAQKSPQTLSWRLGVILEPNEGCLPHLPM